VAANACAAASGARPHLTIDRAEVRWSAGPAPAGSWISTT